MLSFFSRDVLDGILDLIESVSEGFPTYCIVQILLMLEVLFTKDSEVAGLFRGASSGSKPGLFYSNHLFGFKPIQDDFQHGFARVNDGANGSVVLAEL